jgi:thioredoxin 1
MPIIEVDENNFFQELSSAFKKKDTVIIKFGSEYCEPCHALECELEEIDEDLEHISILMVDTDDYPELAEGYDVYELPTMIIYRDIQTKIYHSGGVILASDIKQIIKDS